MIRIGKRRTISALALKTCEFGAGAFGLLFSKFKK